MIIKMQVTGKMEYQNGTNKTTTLNLAPVSEAGAATAVGGSLTITTTDQVYADSLNFHDILNVDIEATVKGK